MPKWRRQRESDGMLVLELMSALICIACRRGSPYYALNAEFALCLVPSSRAAFTLLHLAISVIGPHFWETKRHRALERDLAVTLAPY